VEVEPNRLKRNMATPPTQISSFFINGQRINPHRPNITVPAWGDKNLEIRYAGLSFVTPEKVTFRYILEGYEKDWTDAATRREAFYTNLPPGNFVFKVMARNADGVWSRKGAEIAFTVEPRLYQQKWFFPIVALALALSITSAYLLRVKQLRKQFDLVLAERTRIARELHDTLLQGLSGITMQLQALWTRLPVSKEKNALAEIIEDAGRCSREARQSLWGLRSSRSGPASFSQKLEELVRETAGKSPAMVFVEIAPVVLPGLPETEYQLLRIAQEALSNTLRHAGASRISVVLAPRDAKVELRIEDDGAGFGSVERAATGHYGLTGMFERAAEIGAELKVDSCPGGGTAVTILLPAPQANPQSNQQTQAEHLIR
jgi:signal transduction histidine kinase